MKITQYQIENKASYKNKKLNSILKSILADGINDATMSDANKFVKNLNDEYQAVTKRINQTKLSLLINLTLAYQYEFRAANRINELFSELNNIFKLKEQAK